MNTNVDLRQLAVRREESASSIPKRRSRHWMARVALPGVVLVGFLAVIAWAARDQLIPSRAVTVVPVLTSHTDVQSEGTPLFQAAGWVEPRPTPILVTALAEGVVEKLFVVEGKKLKAGDQVAQLVQEDARLGLQSAEADLELRRAEVEQAKAALCIAQTALPFQLKAARSHLDFARDSFESKKKATESGASALLALPHAKSDLDSATSAVADLEIRAGIVKGQGPGPFAEAKAIVKAATARSKQAQVALAAAQLRLDRTIIKAPVDGQVITLIARPGQRLMGQSAIGHPEASTVITMFDPGMIQVRADVRLEDVPKVLPGQTVKIVAPVAANPLDGEVLQVTSLADIQKNTLQVKVAVNSPPPTLRPDMLVQATFLASAIPKGVDGDKQTLRLLIPKQLVESADGGSYVWVADLANKAARKRSVKLGRPSSDLVEVIDGLNPLDRLITGGRQDLRDGQRITVTGEEAGIGSVHNETGPRPKRLPNPAGDQGHSGKH